MTRYWVLVFLAFMTFACSSEEKTAEGPAQPTHTLIFIDKTASVSMADNYVVNKYQQIIKDAIANNIQNADDKLSVYFIHENTAKGKSISLTSRTPAIETEGMSETDMAAAKSTHDLMLKKEHLLFTKQALNKLMEQNAGTSYQETDIAATIPIINNALSSGEKVEAYFLSDMIESKKGARDFHISPPSASESESWSAEDAKKFADANLIGADVYMVLPFKPTASSKENNPNVTDYWQKLFSELGANVSEL